MVKIPSIPVHRAHVPIHSLPRLDDAQIRKKRALVFNRKRSVCTCPWWVGVGVVVAGQIRPIPCGRDPQ